MARPWQGIGDGARAAAASTLERLGEVFEPTLRLGVTGLSRSGKTVFLAALVHNLVHGGRLPLFAPYAQGRLVRASLAPQPDDEVPRFPYETHVEALVDERRWPASTRRIAQLRVTLEYEASRTLARRYAGGRRLHLDLIDYPGEWLLDLPLMGLSYAEWSAEALHEAERRPSEAAPFRDALAGTAPDGPAREEDARRLAEAFTTYLRAARADPDALAALPPGRFLMPGDLEGSPALTFAPLPPADGTAAAGTLRAMLERRYEAYKAHVVRPFFKDHFARLDRQIVLVDVLAALNGGPAALEELRRALKSVLACFRTGKVSFLGSLVDRRIDKILFAATKADHLHHRDHDRLEIILEHLVAEAKAAAAYTGATVDVAALAAVRATREASVARGGETFRAIAGTPLAGERFEGRTFDGSEEIGLFPGDLPDDPLAVFSSQGARYGVTTLRFRPGRVARGEGESPALPHIRLDRVMQYLIGDRLA